MRDAIIICLIQHFEADFLWKVSLKILNLGIILKTFTHETSMMGTFYVKDETPQILLAKTLRPGYILLVCVDSLCPSQHFFSYVRMGLPGLSQYLAEDKVSSQRHNTVPPVMLKLATLRS